MIAHSEVSLRSKLTASEVIAIYGSGIKRYCPINWIIGNLPTTFILGVATESFATEPAGVSPLDGDVVVDDGAAVAGDGLDAHDFKPASL
jgi:hypothetical protein